jgi:cytochrome c oxidase assembly protein subunit 15
MSQQVENRGSIWPNCLAWLLVCATFPLIWVGGLVTTTDSGMAFRDWLTSDGTFFLFYDWLSSAGEKFVEHGHRLLGATAGFLAIGLALVVTFAETRPWVKKFSYLILAAVVLQGVLGGARVVFDERTLALIHGCTGPLFFALCVAMVVFTSRWWSDVEPQAANPNAKKIFRLAIVCACLAYAQLVVGAVVRHSPHMMGQLIATIFQVAVYFHLLLAILITAHVLLLAWRCTRTGLQRMGGICLLMMIGMQLLLGMGTWLVKYGLPGWAATWLGEMTFVNREADALQAAIITSHVAVGSLILALSVAIAIRLGRQLGFGLPSVSAMPLAMTEVTQ